jgi:hypothetical protein
VIAPNQPAGGGQQQRESHIGGRPIDHPRGMADPNATRRGIGQRNVIDSHAEVADHFGAGQSIEQLTIDPRMAVGVDRRHISGLRRVDLVPRQPFHDAFERTFDRLRQRFIGQNERQLAIGIHTTRGDWREVAVGGKSRF